MRLAAVAVLVALALPAAAAAHLKLSPGVVEAGRATELVIELPPLGTSASEGLAVEGPGVETLSTRAAGLFGADSRWRVVVRIEGEPGPVPLTLRVRLADGRTVDVAQTVTLVPGRPEAAGRNWLAPALAAAVAAGLAAGGLALLRRRRPA
jgi:hypothetical protein